MSDPTLMPPCEKRALLLEAGLHPETVDALVPWNNGARIAAVLRVAKSKRLGPGWIASKLRERPRPPVSRPSSADGLHRRLCRRYELVMEAMTEQQRMEVLLRFGSIERIAEAHPCPHVMIYDPAAAAAWLMDHCREEVNGADL